MNNDFNINIEEDDMDIQINDAIIQGGEIDINLENGEGQDSIKQKVTDQSESQNQARGKFAIGLGHGNTADGKGSLAVGGDNLAYADHSAAIGYKNKASAGNALALGCRTTAVGDSAISAGYSQNKALQQITQNTSYGEVMRAYAQVGPFTLAQKYGAFAHGQDTLALGQNSEAGGQGTIAFSEAQEAKGKFNEPKAGMVRVTGWGTAHNNRKNIEELDRDGTLDIMGMPKTEFSVLTARFMKKYPMLFNCVSFVLKNWTADQWDNVYGKLGYKDVAWSGTNHLTKEIEGTFFALYGSTHDHSEGGEVFYDNHIAILRSTGGNPTDPTDSRASGQVIAKYDYLKGSKGSIEYNKEDLFKILGLE